MTRFQPEGDEFLRFSSCCWIIFHLCSLRFIRNARRKYYWLSPFFKRCGGERFARAVCFNTWKQFSRINRELCYTLCIIEYDTVQTFVLWSQTNRYYGIGKVSSRYWEFQWKTGSLYFYWTYIRSSRNALSPRCLLFLPRVMAIKIIKCLYTRAYAQLYVPALTRLLPLFLTYRIFRDRIFRKRSIEHTHSSIPPFLLKFPVSK